MNDELFAGGESFAYFDATVGGAHAEDKDAFFGNIVRNNKREIALFARANRRLRNDWRGIVGANRHADVGERAWAK